MTGSSIIGASTITVGASLLKTIPGAGSTLGSLAMSVSAGALTYALGQVLALFFERGGNFSDFVVEDHKDLFLQKLAEGERKAREKS